MDKGKSRDAYGMESEGEKENGRLSQSGQSLVESATPSTPSDEDSTTAERLRRILRSTQDKHKAAAEAWQREKEDLQGRVEEASRLHRHLQSEEQRLQRELSDGQLAQSLKSAHARMGTLSSEVEKWHREADKWKKRAIRSDEALEELRSCHSAPAPAKNKLRTRPESSEPPTESQLQKTAALSKALRSAQGECERLTKTLHATQRRCQTMEAQVEQIAARDTVQSQQLAARVWQLEKDLATSNAEAVRYKSETEALKIGLDRADVLCKSLPQATNTAPERNSSPHSESESAGGTMALDAAYYRSLAEERAVQLGALKQSLSYGSTSVIAEDDQDLSGKLAEMQACYANAEVRREATERRFLGAEKEKDRLVAEERESMLRAATLCRQLQEMQEKGERQRRQWDEERQERLSLDRKIAELESDLAGKNARIAGLEAQLQRAESVFQAMGSGESSTTMSTTSKTGRSQSDVCSSANCLALRATCASYESGEKVLRESVTSALVTCQSLFTQAKESGLHSESGTSGSSNNNNTEMSLMREELSQWMERAHGMETEIRSLRLRVVEAEESLSQQRATLVASMDEEIVQLSSQVAESVWHRMREFVKVDSYAELLKELTTAKCAESMSLRFLSLKQDETAALRSEANHLRTVQLSLKQAVSHQSEELQDCQKRLTWETLRADEVTRECSRLRTSLRVMSTAMSQWQRTTQLWKAWEVLKGDVTAVQPSDVRAAVTASASVAQVATQTPPVKLRAPLPPSRLDREHAGQVEAEKLAAESEVERLSAECDHWQALAKDNKTAVTLTEYSQSHSGHTSESVICQLSFTVLDLRRKLRLRQEAERSLKQALLEREKSLASARQETRRSLRSHSRVSSSSGSRKQHGLVAETQETAAAWMEELQAAWSALATARSEHVRLLQDLVSSQMDEKDSVLRESFVLLQRSLQVKPLCVDIGCATMPVSGGHHSQGSQCSLLTEQSRDKSKAAVSIKVAEPTKPAAEKEKEKEREREKDRDRGSKGKVPLYEVQPLRSSRILPASIIQPLDGDTMLVRICGLYDVQLAMMEEKLVNVLKERGLRASDSMDIAALWKALSQRDAAVAALREEVTSLKQKQSPPSRKGTPSKAGGASTSTTVSSAKKKGRTVSGGRLSEAASHRAVLVVAIDALTDVWHWRVHASNGAVVTMRQRGIDSASMATDGAFGAWQQWLGEALGAIAQQ